MNSYLKWLVFPAIVAAFYIFGYQGAFQKLILRWDSGDNSYCYLVVPLFFYLLYEMKASFRFDRFSWSPWGLVPAIGSAGLIVFGELGSVETLVYAGLWGCIASTVFTLYGRRTLRLAFPLLILLFIVPLPPFVNRMLTFQLKLAASTLAVQFLRLSGVSVLQEGNIIDIGLEQLQVVDACSGLRYFMPLILLALLMGHFFNKGWWRRLALLVAVPPLSVFMNGIRIFVTGMLIVNGHKELAEDFFHDFSGWLVFMIAGAVLYGFSALLKRIGKPPADRSAPDPGGAPAKRWLPQALTAALCLLFVGTGWAVREIPAVRNLPERSAFAAFPMQIGEWQGSRGYLTQEILDSLWADDYVTATFRNASPHNRIHLLIPFYAYQGTRHTAHAPQSCLLGGGFTLLHTEDRELALEGGERLRFKTMLLKKDDQRMLASYFFFQRGRVITSPWMNKFYLVWDSLTRRRTDGALVRVEMTMGPSQSVDEAMVLLTDFLSGLWPLLPKYIPT